MITPIKTMTINQIMERKDDLLVSVDDIKEIAINERNKAIDKFIHIIQSNNSIADFMKDYLQEIAEEYNNGWISCSERLPKEKVCDDGYVEPSDAVLVFTKYGSCKVSRYWGNRRNKRDYYDWVDIDYRKKEVLAWQPLPKPYKE